MKKTTSVILPICVVLILCLGTCGYAQDSLTFTTFYPAPFGAYDSIRLVPRNGPPAACDDGTIYVDSNDGELHICGGGLGAEDAISAWTQVGNDIYPRDGTGPNVGVGTTSPIEKFQVSAGDALFEQNITVTQNVIANGNIGVGTAAPLYRLDVNGAGKIDNLYLRADGTNVGELQVEYVGGAYYATYAP